MSKFFIAAAIALVGLGLSAAKPALAGKGNGESFPYSFGVTRRPGSNLSVLGSVALTCAVRFLDGV